MEDESEWTTGYMCKVDFDFELGSALGGSRIYPSEDDCRDVHKCVDACGMVEVEVRLRQVISEGSE